MKFHHCPKCGQKTTLKNAQDDGLVPYCIPCEQYLFDVTPVAIITAIINPIRQVLLIKQDYIGDFFVLVAGFVQGQEDLESACIREVKEEVGQEVISLRYVRSFYFERRDQLMVGFISEVNFAPLSLSQEVAFANWYSLKDALNLVRSGTIAHQVLVATHQYYTSLEPLI